MKMETTQLFVLLASCGNPDFRQNPNQPISPYQIAVVTTLDEASKACREYIEEHELGGGNWIGGQVYTSLEDMGAHTKVGYISYNGRPWTSGDTFSYNPSAKIIKAAQAAHAENQKPWKIILQQLGGGHFIAMTGAHGIFRDGDNILIVKFKGSRAANYLRVEYVPGIDTYNMQMGRTGKSGYKITDQHEGVYADMLTSLFTSHTGLNTNL